MGKAENMTVQKEYSIFIRPDKEYDGKIGLRIQLKQTIYKLKSEYELRRSPKNPYAIKPQTNTTELFLPKEKIEEFQSQFTQALKDLENFGSSLS